MTAIWMGARSPEERRESVVVDGPEEVGAVAGRLVATSFDDRRGSSRPGNRGVGHRAVLPVGPSVSSGNVSFAGVSVTDRNRSASKTAIDSTSFTSMTRP